MLDNLKDYLKLYAPVEQQQLLTDVYSALSGAGLDGHETAVHTALELYGENRNECLDAITDILKTLLMSEIREFGVTTDGDMASSLIIFNALSGDIEEYPETDLIDAIVSSDSTNDEILSDLIALVNSTDAESILIHLESVSNSLIDRIASVNYAKIQPDVELHPEEKKAIIARFQAWVGRNVDRKNTLAYKALINGASFGQDFGEVIREAWPVIEQMAVAEQQASELFTFALMSELKNDALIPHVSECLELMGVDGMKFSNALKNSQQFVDQLNQVETAHA